MAGSPTRRRLRERKDMSFRLDRRLGGRTCTEREINLAQKAAGRGRGESREH